jgi:hypothetical protein
LGWTCGRKEETARATGLTQDLKRILEPDAVRLPVAAFARLIQ